MGKTPAELYYYCSECQKFHYMSGGHGRSVDKKLCFICNTKGTKNTRILRSSDGGATQICEKCQKEMALLHR